jgi:hypothetical protein
MRKVSRQHRDFWIGTLQRSGSNEFGLVVYDPLAHAATGDNYVVLFKVSESATGDFRKEVVRDFIGSVAGYSDKEIESAVDAYCCYAGIDIAEEHRRRESDRQAVIYAHQRFLKSRGLTLAGTRHSSGRTHRVTNCYNCMSHLDNAIDVECEACGWIVCACGACGCGYHDGPPGLG